MAILSILDKLSHENHPEKYLYNITLKVFDYIENDNTPVDIIFVYFLFQLAKSLGFELHLKSSDIFNNFNEIDLDLTAIKLKYDDLTKIKIIIYKHIREHLVDLNDLHSVRVLRKYGLSTRPNKIIR
tara:strand:- start:156 stop:536 length:381 start_codon:yes stop_codon:yes gene_type:complete